MMPADLKDKEKTIGGVLTMEQLVYLILGAAVGVVVGMILGAITTPGIGIFIGFILCFSGIPFAFIRPYKMSLISYIVSAYTFKKKKKNLTKY